MRLSDDARKVRDKYFRLRDQDGRLRTRVWIALAVAALILLVLLRVNFSAELACDHFRGVAREVQAGILSVPEIRTKLKEVHDDGHYSSPKMRNATRKMLAGITAQDFEQFGEGVSEMETLCSELGL